MAPSSPSYLKFWGTRGSIPVAGLDYCRYGGNTSCLEIRHDNSLVIIDAGTGIRPLGNEVMASGIDEIHLFIGHTHWDHIIGFPFFAPVYDSSKTIHIYAAKGGSGNIEELFSGMLEQDFFPVNLDDMRAKFCFHELEGRSETIGDIEVNYTQANHPGATLCFRIKCCEHDIGYATDNEFLQGFCGHPKEVSEELLKPYQPIVDFFKGCSTLIHEAQYSPEEYATKIGWGHSSIYNVALMADLCGAQEWIITHHDPDDNDTAVLQKRDMNKKIRQECNISCRSSMAYDGLILPLN